MQKYLDRMGSNGVIIISRNLGGSSEESAI